MEATTFSKDIPPAIALVISENGYLAVREVDGEGWCGLLQFAFTWAIVVGITPECYGRRYCYEHESDASRALASWSGHDHPLGPWIKCKGVGVDILNPELEMI
jgi:hypothetical protein